MTSAVSVPVETFYNQEKPDSERLIDPIFLARTLTSTGITENFKNVVGMTVATGWNSPFRQLQRVFPKHVKVIAEASGGLVTSVQLISQLRRESSMTWDQLAKMFGVTRRTMHMWASGGKLNSSNHELLSHLVSIVENLPGSNPEHKRAHLLAPRRGRMSIFDEIRSKHASSKQDVNRSPFDLAQVLGEIEGE